MRHALAQAGDEARGTVLASDAFFPFPDSVELAAESGVVAVMHPGGSVRDQDVARAALERACPCSGAAAGPSGTREGRDMKALVLGSV